MALLRKIFKYKKIVMLALIVLGLCICVAGAYLTTYKRNLVTIEDVIPTKLTGYEKVSEEEFLANFNKFEIKETSYIKPFENNGTAIDGYKTYTVYAEAADGSKIRGDLKITIGLGASWVGYKSETDTQEIKIGKEKQELIINVGFDDVFPQKGKLWFIKAEQPVLYVLVEWSEKLNTKPYKYTYLEFDYSKYSK